VRQRLDQRGVDRENRIEEVGEVDSVGLGDQAESGAIAVKAPGPAVLENVQPGFVVPVEQLIGNLASGRLIRQLERV
jgi:hypothetical protein